jgi:hypothetical protein
MSFPKNIARFKPTPAVLDLGRPERIFHGSATTAAVIKAVMLLLGLVCIAGTLGAAIGFFMYAPAELRNDARTLGLLGVGAALLVAVGGMFVYGAYWLPRASCYLIYPDGMAFTQGKGWDMLAWEDVAEFRPSTHSHYPHLLMLDGSKVQLHESASYINTLHEVIQDRLLETRADHGIPLEAVDEQPAEPHAADPKPKEEPESPVGLVFGGVLLVAAAAWFYLHLKGLEDAGGGEFTSHWIVVLAYLIGGKVVAAGLILLVGLGLIVKGLLLQGEQEQKEEPARKKSGQA